MIAPIILVRGRGRTSAHPWARVIVNALPLRDPERSACGHAAVYTRPVEPVAAIDHWVETLGGDPA